ncbi:hypothetical protein AB3M92_08565 [Micrococcus luteus]
MTAVMTDQVANETPEHIQVLAPDFVREVEAGSGGVCDQFVQL